MNFETQSFDNNRLIVNDDFVELLKLNAIDSAQKLWNIEGEAVKKILKHRGTERVFLTTPSGDKLEVYIKRYDKAPFKERLKQAFSLKFHTFNAIDEWTAIRAFQRLDLPTMTPIAIADLGNGRTCNLTLGIRNYVKAAELFKNFKDEDHLRKTALIEKIAYLAGRMHQEGFAHQDFYLVHIFVCEKDEIYLIDLQRLIMQKNLGKRWRVKDLGQLLFAAKPYVSDIDIRRFWRFYCSFAGRKFYRDKCLIKAIYAKAEKIEARDAKKGRSK